MRATATSDAAATGGGGRAGVDEQRNGGTDGRTDGGWRARAVGRTDGRTGNEQRELASPLAVCKRPKGGEGKIRERDYT